MVLARRRGRNLDHGFELVSDPQVADASYLRARQITWQAFFIGLAFGAVVAAVPV